MCLQNKIHQEKEDSKLLLRVGKVPLASIDALHLSHYSAAICALFCRSVPLWQDWQKEKYLPCATCFPKHIISKMAISSLGGFVPLNQTLTYSCRAGCSNFTARSCVRSWAANHKNKMPACIQQARSLAPLLEHSQILAFAFALPSRLTSSLPL